MSLALLRASCAPAPVPRLDIAKSALLAPRQARAHVIRKRSVVGTESAQQIVYCVALEPDAYDLHRHIMTPEEVEFTAHAFMEVLAEQAEAKMVRAMHEDPISAIVVESYIAPQDLRFRTGTYGPQVVKKGSWVLGIKVRDPDEWAKVVSGAYTGISVGGVGLLGDI